MLPGGTRVYTSPAHRIGTDALLLAGFCRPPKAGGMADLGAGCGILGLSLLDAGWPGRVTAIEQDDEAVALLRLAAAAQPRLAPLQADLRAYRPARPFAGAIANPPYFAAGPRSGAPRRAAARHEDSLPLGELCAAAARLLRHGARFTLCYPPARLAGLFSALTAQRLAPKRLMLVRKSPEKAPSLALCEAVKGGGEGLIILPEHILSAPLSY